MQYLPFLIELLVRGYRNATARNQHTEKIEIKH